MANAGGLLTQKTVLLAKIESTYGTDPVPVPSTDALEIFEASAKINQENVVRNPLRTSISQLPIRKSLKQQEITFRTELKGGGTAGTAPAIGKLFKACGLVETASVGSSVIYAPGNPASSITFYLYKDGTCYVITGAVGTFELQVEAGKIPMVNWTFRGLYAIPVDSAIPSSPTYESTIGAVAESTGTSFSGFNSAIIRSYSIDLANEIAERKSINSAGGIVGQRITNRTPKGKMLLEAELRATEDMWSDWDASTVFTFNSVIGTVAGNIVTITSTSNAQFDELTPADDNGIYMYDSTLLFSGTDNEFQIKFT